jgi:hypothetical protein
MGGSGGGSGPPMAFGGSYELGGKMTQEDFIVCIGNMNRFVPSLAPESAAVKRSFYAVFDGK